MWLSPPPEAVRTSIATYTPDTAVEGTAQLAETLQLPQSSRCVLACAPHAGCVRAVGDSEVIKRAPLPW
jgi:hypothetical protein